MERVQRHPYCLRLFRHCIRRPDSRADWTAGSSKPTSMPMIAMTTKSSTRVKPGLWRSRRDMGERHRDWERWILLGLHYA